MRNTALFVVLITAGLTAQTAPYVYVPVNDLRQERDRAQWDWQRTAPNLEAHLAKAPKNQVLAEIDRARAAARRFGEAEVKYLEGRLTNVESQIANLQTRGVAAPAALARQMTDNIRMMLQQLSDDRQSIQGRLSQLDPVKRALSNEEILTRNQLEVELKLVDKTYVDLAQQRDKLETTTGPAAPDLEETRGALVTELVAMQQLTQQQRDRARRSIDLFESYYGNLRTAVQKRPDDAPASSPAPAAAPPARGAAGGDARRKPPPAPPNNRAGEETDPPKAGGGFTATRAVNFAGLWTLPENASQLAGPCSLKSALMNLRVDSRGNVSGTLTLMYDRGGSPAPCPSTRKSATDQLSLRLEGAQEGQRLTLKFEATGPVIGAAATEVRGRLEMRARDEYLASISVTEGDATKLGLAGAVFHHRR